MNYIIALFRPHARMERCISAYVDGELPPREIGRFAAHLPACEACSRAVAEERALKSMLSTSLPNVPAPRSFRLTEAMIARPAASGRAVPRRQVQGQALAFARISQFGAAAAGLALLSVVVFDFSSGGGTTTADPLIEAAGDTSIADGDAAAGDDDSGGGQLPPEGTPAIPTPGGGVTGSSESPTPADADTGSYERTEDGAAGLEDAVGTGGPGEFGTTLVSAPADDPGPGKLRAAQLLLGIVIVACVGSYFLARRAGSSRDAP